MANHGISQQELDTLISGYNYGGMRRYASKVRGSVLPSGIPVVHIDGRTLGLAESSYIVKLVFDMVRPIQQHIIIDLTDCKYLSSFTLGSLSSLARERLSRGQLVVIAGANDMVKDVIKLSGLDEYLRMCVSPAEAEKVLLGVPDMP